MSSPLDGIRVLDLSRHLAGPYCAMMLGDLGAEVIKVERPGAGDETRQWGPPFIGGESAYYLCCNRNKKSITLNLKDPADAEKCRQLAARSDVLIENFRVGGLDEMGLGYDTLKPLNPRLIFCSITGFGQTGPYRDRLGYDFVIQAMGGLMSITGEPDRPPMKVGVALVDVSAAMFACIGILAALQARERTGEGQRVDVSLFDSQVAWLANVGSNYLCSGVVPQRWGNAHASIVPYQAFATADDYIVIAVGNDGQWQRLCKVLGKPEWKTDPRFATNPQRVAHRNTLVPLIEEILLRKPAAEWLTALEAHDVPAAPVNTIDKVFADPQVLAREMLIEMPHPTAGVVRMAGTPIKLSATPAQMKLPPPLLGEHNEEVLGAS
jgi:formyl-CoA transferase